MSERELEEIEKSAYGYMQTVEEYGNRAYGRERDVHDMAEEMLLLASEVRRSHTEAAELRERVGDLEGALSRIGERKSYEPSYVRHNIELIAEMRGEARAALSQAKLENQGE